jgi:hypothetical protein
VEAETVDAGAPEVVGDESITLAVKSTGDELYHRRAEARGEAPEPAAMLTDDRLIDFLWSLPRSSRRVLAKIPLRNLFSLHQRG